MPEYVTGKNDSPWPDLPKSTQDYLREGAAVGSRDNALFKAACQSRDCGYTQAEAEAALIDRAVKDGLSEACAKRKIDSAYSKDPREVPHSKHSATSSNSSADPKPAAPPPKPQSLPKPIADGFKVLLETCFRKGEGVAIGKGYREAGELKIDGGDVLRRERWLTKAKPPTNKTGEGIFVRVNPMCPGGKADKDVTAYRQVLVEFDEDENGSPIPKEIQFSILVNSGFPIATICDSGNVSLQGLIIVDAADRTEFDQRAQVILQYFSRFEGFDASTSNPSRYCRLPGASRLTNNGAIAQQELLAVSVGPANWAEYENPTRVSEEECREHDAEVLKRFLKEDRPFPEPMDNAAFYGLAGQVTSIIAADNEPCRESILGHFLIMVGNVIGWNAWMDQGGEQHLNEFGLFAGPSGIGRKGTAYYLVRRLLLEVDPDWAKRRIRKSLQTGEAIIHAIRDPSTKGTGKHATYDAGVKDKRLVIMETEATRFLNVGQRRGNSLFDVVHDCWDSVDPLCADSKTAGEEATHPHVSMIAHTVPEYYLSRLPEEEKISGSVNRSMILAVRRAQIKARPPTIHWSCQHPQIVSALRTVLETFKIRRELHWSPEAEKLWDSFYGQFNSKTKGGMVSSILDRLPTHVLRAAMIYCALDNSCTIELVHLQAALAFCDYYRRSAEWLFGETTGNKRADRIYKTLVRIAPESMGRSEIAEECFSKRIAKAELDELLRLLIRADLIYQKSERNPRKGPRFIDRFYARLGADTSELSVCLCKIWGKEITL